MNPTVTITLKEYNELISIKNDIDKTIDKSIEDKSIIKIFSYHSLCSLDKEYTYLIKTDNELIKILSNSLKEKEKFLNESERELVELKNTKTKKKWWQI